MASAPRTPISGELLVTPDPALPNVQILIQRDRKSEVIGLFVSKDNGASFKPFLPIPLDNDKPGSVPTLGVDGKVRWQAIPVPGIKTGSGSLSFIEESFHGALVPNTIFGYFRVPTGVSFRCVEIQATVQSAANAQIKIDILNGSNVAQNKVTTIQTGNTSAIQVLSTAVVMNQNSIWKFKILQAGTSLPGEELKVRMVLVRN